MTDTIYAPATAPGRAAVAVVRVSGPASADAVRGLAGVLPPPRRASLRTLRDAAGEALDRALVLWTPAPASYTGEDGAELHLHGGPAVLEGVVEALDARGLRLAEPGEFTRRAFANGRMDLTEAEAVADLVEAESAAQRRQALDQLGGALAARHLAWRDTLLDALAHLEAAVDFPDEDLPDEVAARARGPLLSLKDELEAAAHDRRGERVREGLRIALIGPPNAGKSTLLNALLGREAAIVAPTPGTTRDVVEGRLTLAGVPALLADTAGLRASPDPVEMEGVRRARAWAAAADLRVAVRDLAAPEEGDEAAALLQPGDLVLENKSDLIPAAPAARRAPAGARTTARDGSPDRSPDGDLSAPPPAPGQTLVVSAHAAQDVARVRGWLEAWAARVLGGGEPPAATRLRHRLALADAAAALDRATAPDASRPELMAEDVRLAVRALGRLSGRVDAEEVLGRVFSTFCIGK